MTVPEENREKTGTTDDTLAKSERRGAERRDEGGGRSMREALDEAGITPEDYEERGEGER